MITIALNGFGRIGRSFLRALLLDPIARTRITVAVINIGAAKIEDVAHMFKYDTVMRTFPGTVTMKNNTLIIDDVSIKIIAQTDPQKINWHDYHISWVIDATGKFTTRDRAQLHLASGASFVLITAPAQQEDIAIIPGINENKFNPAKDHIVSLGSCTTNAFIPMLNVLQNNFGIEECSMTTLHAYTNDQVLLDVEHRDLRRARAAALNIIPTSTGAGTMVEKIMPALQGKTNALAIRVPVGIVSLIDLTFTSSSKLTAKDINNAFVSAAEKSLSKILGIMFEQLVSSDFIQSPLSVTIDGTLTTAHGNMGKTFGWYDNEWGYSNRLKDFLLYVDSINNK